MVKREVVDTIREDDAESTETGVDRHTVNSAGGESQRMCLVCSHSFRRHPPISVR